MICPSCHSRDLQLIGKIPATDQFAGRHLPEPMDGGKLYRCRACYLYFRYPKPSEQLLDALYARGAINHWHTRAELRNDWQIVSSWIRANLPRGSKLLDVGCFDGQFLELVGEGYRRFGIELHEKASEIARSSGISIAGHDFNDLNESVGVYDAVTAIDVIEHVPDPYGFLGNLSRVTRKGGLIIVSSGNTESIPWRIARSRYYYCTIAEHMSFINARWCRTSASKIGLELERIYHFSHSRVGFMQRAREVGKNMLYIFAPEAAAWSRARGFGGKDVKLHKALLGHPPAWVSARDHLAVAFKKV